MFVILVAQVFCQLINDRNNHHNNDAGEADGIVRERDHLMFLYT